MKNVTFEFIGTVSVEAGVLSIGDPCHLADKNVFEDWDAFCKSFKTNSVDGVLSIPEEGDLSKDAPSKVLVVSVPAADGIYPVFAEKDEDGRVLSISIDFLPVEEEEELYGELLSPTPSEELN